jgi:transposase
VFNVLKTRKTRDGRRSLSDKEVDEVKVLLREKDWTQREIAVAFEVGIKTIEGVSRAMKEEVNDGKG